MVIQSASLALNALLAPMLIVGWGTGRPLGVAGAGLATTLASAAGLLALTLLFHRMRTPLRLELVQPRPAVWGRIAGVGLPAGGEFLLMFLYMSLVYLIIRPFGSEAQAGFGVGARVMQAVFLPAMAVAFAAAPIAGQNFGARNAHRVRATFRQAALIGSAIMLLLTLLCQIQPEILVRPFADDPGTLGVAADYLRVISWNFVGVGLTFAASGMFQALGDTRPALLASATRLLTFALPALWLAGQPGFRLHDVWLVSVASVLIQVAVSLWLLRGQFRRKLGTLEIAPPTAGTVQPQAGGS
jgi:putative MATE family efflux protein